MMIGALGHILDHRRFSIDGEDSPFWHCAGEPDREVAGARANVRNAGARRGREGSDDVIRFLPGVARRIVEARHPVLCVLETMVGMVGLLMFVVAGRRMRARDQ